MVPALPECGISGAGWNLLLDHTLQTPSTHSFLSFFFERWCKEQAQTYPDLGPEAQGRGSYGLELWSQMAWAHLPAPLLAWAGLWAGLFTSLTLNFLSCEMRKTFEERGLIGAGYWMLHLHFFLFSPQQ